MSEIERYISLMEDETQEIKCIPQKATNLRKKKENDDNDSKIWILGKIFLRNIITIFDSEKQEIRFYKENLIDTFGNVCKTYELYGGSTDTTFVGKDCDGFTFQVQVQANQTIVKCATENPGHRNFMT